MTQEYQTLEPAPTNGAVIEGVRLVMEVGVTVTGIVRDSEGAPVAGARVRVGPDYSTLGAAGLAGGFDTTSGSTCGLWA